MSATPGPLAAVQDTADPQRQMMSVFHTASTDPEDTGHYQSLSRVRQTSIDLQETFHPQYQAMPEVRGTSTDLHDTAEPQHQAVSELLMSSITRQDTAEPQYQTVVKVHGTPSDPGRVDELMTGQSIYHVQDCGNNLVIYEEVWWDQEEGDAAAQGVQAQARSLPAPGDTPYLHATLDFLSQPTYSMLSFYKCTIKIVVMTSGLVFVCLEEVAGGLVQPSYMIARNRSGLQTFICSSTSS